MSLSFPATPSIGQTYLNWIWDGNAWQNVAGGGAPINVQVFTSNGTYTPTPGMTTCLVEVLGGGGAGGGAAGAASNYVNAGGGGAGGYSRSFLTFLTVGASQPITVGAGGTPGAANNAPGGNGGNSSFGSLVTANGGQGGLGASSSVTGYGGAGGASGTGMLAANGAPGGNGYITAIAVNQPAGAGASSPWGGGGQVTALGGTGATTGNAASNYGSGGGGGHVANSTAGAAGGAGSPGIVIVTEYSNVSLPGSGGGGGPLLGLQVFTSAGTYTPTAGMTTAVIECIGGGGGGNGCAATGSTAQYAGGGGAGGYSRKFVTAAQVGVSQVVTVGAGGAGATVSGVGGAGSNTSVGSLCIANGATAAVQNLSPGIGGAAGTGDVAGSGANGNSGNNFQATGSYTTGGNGASTLFGGGGRGVYGSGGTAPAGQPGTGFGSGGAGGSSVATNGVGQGGAGAPGVVIISEYGSPAQPSGSKVMLSKQVVSSAVASVDFLSGINWTAYDLYEVEFYGVQLSAATGLSLRCSTDGATFDNGSNYGVNMLYNNATTTGNSFGSYTGSATAGQMTPSGLANTQANITYQGKMRCWNLPITGLNKYFKTENVTQSAAGGFQQAENLNWYNPSGQPAVVGLRFLTTAAGNITAGTFILYGIVK